MDVSKSELTITGCRGFEVLFDEGRLDSEDVDSAICSEIPPSHYQANGKVTSMLVHEQSGYLFLGTAKQHIYIQHPLNLFCF